MRGTTAEQTTPTADSGAPPDAFAIRKNSHDAIAAIPPTIAARAASPNQMMPSVIGAPITATMTRR